MAAEPQKPAGLILKLWPESGALDAVMNDVINEAAKAANYSMLNLTRWKVAPNDMERELLISIALGKNHTFRFTASYDRLESEPLHEIIHELLENLTAWMFVVGGKTFAETK